MLLDTKIMRFEDSAPPSAPYRLIVAVDYGTTYSGEFRSH
jgi:hypothetical protein